MQPAKECEDAFALSGRPGLSPTPPSPLARTNSAPDPATKLDSKYAAHGVHEASMPGVWTTSARVAAPRGRGRACGAMRPSVHHMARDASVRWARAAPLTPAMLPRGPEAGAPTSEAGAPHATPSRVGEAEHGSGAAPWFARTDALDDVGFWWPALSVNANVSSRVQALARARGWCPPKQDRALKDADGFAAMSHFAYDGQLSGALNVPSADAAALRSALVEDVRNGVFYTLTENKTPVWAAYVDLDFKGELTPTAVLLVTRVCHLVVCSFYPTVAPDTLRVVACVGRSVRGGGGRGSTGASAPGPYVKHGVHLVWPNLCVGMVQQVTLAVNMQSMLKLLLPCLPSGSGKLEEGSAAAWDDVVDLVVYRPSTGLRMVYCPKTHACSRKALHAPGAGRGRGRGSGMPRCGMCRGGLVPDPMHSVYIPFFVLQGRQSVGAAAAQASVHFTPHAVCGDTWDVASTQLLALCSIRRPGLVYASEGYRPPKRAAAVQPDTWTDLRCTPAGVWVGHRRKNLKESRVFSTLQRGADLAPCSKVWAALASLVRTGAPAYASLVLTRVHTYVDVMHRVCMYEIDVDVQGGERGGQHVCGNRPGHPHGNSRVYFTVGSSTRTLVQRCRCKKKRSGAETASGKTCAQYQRTVRPLAPIEMAALFAHEPLTAAERAQVEAQPPLAVQYADAVAAELYDVARAAAARRARETPRRTEDSPSAKNKGARAAPRATARGRVAQFSLPTARFTTAKRGDVVAPLPGPAPGNGTRKRLREHCDGDGTPPLPGAQLPCAPATTRAQELKQTCAKRAAHTTDTLPVVEQHTVENGRHVFRGAFRDVGHLVHTLRTQGFPESMLHTIAHGDTLLLPPKQAAPRV